MVKKVEVERPDTHLYSEHVQAADIQIGQNYKAAAETITLFEKSLVLTSDLKRLPYLVGGKLSCYFDTTIHSDLVTAVLAGLHITSVLLNGDWKATIDGQIGTYKSIIQDKPGRRKEILLVAHGFVWRDTATLMIYFEPEHFQYVGEKVLYDTITLALFADAGAAAQAALASYAWSEMLIEVDWKPLNEDDLQEFLMEHIYARGGEGD